MCAVDGWMDWEDFLKKRSGIVDHRHRHQLQLDELSDIYIYIYIFLSKIPFCQAFGQETKVAREWSVCVCGGVCVVTYNSLLLLLMLMLMLLPSFF